MSQGLLSAFLKKIIKFIIIPAGGSTSHNMLARIYIYFNLFLEVEGVSPDS